MAFTDDSGMIMPVAPTGGFGNFAGGNDLWIIILFILLAGGNGFGGYGSGGGGVGFVDNSVQRGFDQTAIMSGLTGINNTVVSGFGDIQTALCAGFNGVEIGANAREMANMNRMFDLQSQFAQCCCDNRLATVQTQNIVQSEGAATRLAIQNQTQAILDKICALEIEAKNDKISDLERQLALANLAASQVAQTAEIISKLPTTTAAGA